MSTHETAVTRLLQAAGAGDAAAHDRLIAAVYDDLRRVAMGLLARERPGHTLQATAVVHEAYLRLVGSAGTFENRAHFFGAAAEAMRRVLIDSARRRRAGKRGGDRERVTLAELVDHAEGADLDVLALDDALTRLAAEDDRLAQVAKLRYFVGLSIEETAQVLGTSPATVKRDWQFARAWLFARMTGGV